MGLSPCQTTALPLLITMDMTISACTTWIRTRWLFRWSVTPTRHGPKERDAEDITTMYAKNAPQCCKTLKQNKKTFSSVQLLQCCVWRWGHSHCCWQPCLEVWCCWGRAEMWWWLSCDWNVYQLQRNSVQGDQWVSLKKLFQWQRIFNVHTRSWKIIFYTQRSNSKCIIHWFPLLDTNTLGCSALPWRRERHAMTSEQNKEHKTLLLTKDNS